MSKIEYLLVVVYAFIMMITGLLDDYRNASLVMTLVASIVLFYIYYAIGLSFIFVTNGIFKLYKKWRG